MKINEVMKESGLTKKAIYYYEEMDLIKPKREVESNYRIYGMDDIKKLITIHALRKMDFSIKDIQLIVSEKSDFGKAINKQVNIINHKITQLNKSKEILEDLIEHGTEIDIDHLKLSIQCWEKESKNIPGYMQKELNRILPGNIGKLFAIYYGQFLYEPLDSQEKEKAWMDLIHLLDSQQEIQYTGNIKELIDEMFGKVSDDDLLELSEKSKIVTNKILERKVDVSDAEKNEIKKKIQAYEKTLQYQKDIKVQQFMLDNIAPIFKEIDSYLCILSPRFEKFNKIINPSKF